MHVDFNDGFSDFLEMSSSYENLLHELAHEFPIEANQRGRATTMVQSLKAKLECIAIHYAYVPNRHMNKMSLHQLHNRFNSLETRQFLKNLNDEDFVECVNKQVNLYFLRHPHELQSYIAQIHAWLTKLGFAVAKPISFEHGSCGSLLAELLKLVDEEVASVHNLTPVNATLLVKASMECAIINWPFIHGASYRNTHLFDLVSEKNSLDVKSFTSALKASACMVGDELSWYKSLVTQAMVRPPLRSLAEQAVAALPYEHRATDE